MSSGMCYIQQLIVKIMVSALVGICSNLLHGGKLTLIYVSCIFYMKGKFTNCTREKNVVSTIELLHPTDKMLKRGL